MQYTQYETNMRRNIREVITKFKCVDAVSLIRYIRLINPGFHADKLLKDMIKTSPIAIKEYNGITCIVYSNETEINIPSINCFDAYVGFLNNYKAYSEAKFDVKAPSFVTAISEAEFPYDYIVSTPDNQMYLFINYDERAFFKLQHHNLSKVLGRETPKNQENFAYIVVLVKGFGYAGAEISEMEVKGSVLCADIYREGQEVICEFTER